MNERIEELVKQATVSKPYYPPGNDGHPEYKTYVDQEKFAELIVQECARVLHTEMYRLDALPGREVSAQTMETAAVLVKKHFGVE